MSCNGCQVTIDSEFEKQVDEVITHYPASKRSASLPLLHLWQEKYGYVSEQAVHWIANKLGLQPINILELVTFYPMFRQKPFGKCHIRVCRTLSCALAGSYELLAHLKKVTGATGDEHHPMHSADGKFTVEFVECLASCGTGPVMMINDDFYEGVSHQKAEELVKKRA
jgi:NADH-quinone oxidoreductase subunit E